MKKSVIIFSVILGIIFSACESNSVIDAKVLSKTKIEEAAKEFEAKSFNLVTTNSQNISFKTTKNGIDFDDFKGKKAVIIDIFATWCPPCINSLPHLIKLKEKYKDNLEIVSVLYKDDKSVEDMNDFIAKHSINYPIAMGENNQKLADELSVKKVPEMFLFSKDGKFVKKFIGVANEEEIEEFIKLAIDN